MMADGNIFKNFGYIDNTPIVKGTIPVEILEEVSMFVNRCREIKNHPLAQLRNHKNAGINSYQVSVPQNLLMDSFLLAYLIRLGELYSGFVDLSIQKNRRKIRVVSDNLNHYDGFDVWVNFTYKGDSNPFHTHNGNLSGVIYYQNDGQETLFKNAPPFVGTKGDIIMFPSDFLHGVEEKTTDEERITLSYNLWVFQNR